MAIRNRDCEAPASGIALGFDEPSATVGTGRRAPIAPSHCANGTNAQFLRVTRNEREILDGTVRASPEGMNTEKRLVGDVMTRELVTLGRNDRLLVADDIMKLGRIRHLPIVDEEGKLAGIVSQRDLFHSGLLRALGFGSHARQNALDSIVVKEAMKTEVVTTTPETPIRDAAKLMLDRKIGCLVVLENERLVGILTESDFVRLAIS